MHRGHTSLLRGLKFYARGSHSPVLFDKNVARNFPSKALSVNVSVIFFFYVVPDESRMSALAFNLVCTFKVELLGMWPIHFSYPAVR